MVFCSRVILSMGECFFDFFNRHQTLYNDDIKNDFFECVLIFFNRRKALYNDDIKNNFS